jgi:Xaa-Pro aminopeptidase
MASVVRAASLSASRVAALRALLAARGLDAYLVPSEDAHQSEYIADRDKRREFLTGFTGSFGYAVVTPTDAALWTDGRYFLQATRTRPAPRAPAAVAKPTRAHGTPTR